MSKLCSTYTEATLKRDFFQCVTCKRTDEPLTAHYITNNLLMPEGGHVTQNRISLCPQCTEKAEQFHKTKGKDYYEGFHPDDLYKLICSSRLEAIKASTTG